MKKLSYHLNNLNKLFWSKVVESTRVDEKSLSAFRIISGLFLLCFSFPYFVWIEDVPQAFYEPPVLTLTSLYDGFPKSPFFLIVNVLLLILAVCITVGVRARFSSILYLLFLYIAASFHFSFGKIDHGFIFYFMLLLCMCFSNWGSYLAVIPDKKLDPKFNDRALCLLAIFLCFGFFTAGFEKARYQYGMGVFKIDWALDAPIPFLAQECRAAGTIHIGNTLEEIAYSEEQISKGKHPDRPFVLLAQQSLFDKSRAPEGKQVGWAYCHVPNGSS